jgi:hypothetical protein
LDIDRGIPVDLKAKIKIFWPAFIVFFILCVFVFYRLSLKDWDPVGLAEVGTRYQYGESNGTEGYDGQFAYYIAIHPDPKDVSVQLDVPAYRYQRILYPLLARLFSLGNVTWIPWTLILINIVSQVAGTALLCHILVSRQVPVRYSLIYGLWAGAVVSVGTDLYEPLAFFLVIAAMAARVKGKICLGSILLTCSLFAKETAILFWVAVLLEDIVQKRALRNVLFDLVPGIFYGLWQGWVYLQFGAFGLASGGAMATPFEWIPYGGFFRIGSAGFEVLALFSVIFIPTIIFPSIWGTIKSIQILLKKNFVFENWALLLNTFFITFLPFSTFREPLGLIRASTGMVLATVVFSAKHHMRRPLNLGMFWIALIVIAVR